MIFLFERKIFAYFENKKKRINKSIFLSVYWKFIERGRLSVQLLIREID